MSERVTLELNQPFSVSIVKQLSVFNFYLGKWCIEISEKDGIKFNREDFPCFDQNDFARSFCNVLEKNYNVTFTKNI